MKVFLPSWNGDFRLEGDGPGSKLILVEPTPLERAIVGRFLHTAGKKKWTPTAHPDAPYDGPNEVKLDAALAPASRALIKIARPKKQTLTAIKFSGGELVTVEGTDEAALKQIEEKVAAAAATEKPEKTATAASVKRPTPCCPSCEVGSVAPASEVLLSFLDRREHESWSRERAIVVTGGYTGHRYVLAHRSSPIAAATGRVCFDLDDRAVVHFHDNSVPPEEEVLAAKLILEHREPWLRNEATLFDSNPRARHVFKNPFGGYGDGTESAGFASGLGRTLKDALKATTS